MPAPALPTILPGRGLGPVQQLLRQRPPQSTPKRPRPANGQFFMNPG